MIVVTLFFGTILVVVILVIWILVSKTYIPPIQESPLSNTKEDSLFIKDYPLLVFTEKFGPKMQIGEHRNNGKVFHTCRFIKTDGEITDVHFFSQLGELTKNQIESRKNELYVGKMENGKYYLHDENVKKWEDVILE